MGKKSTVSMLMVATLALAFVAFLRADDNNDEQAAITAKAAELAPDDMPDAQRIMALHHFVRDEIRQIKTQYG